MKYLLLRELLPLRFHGVKRGTKRPWFLPAGDINTILIIPSTTKLKTRILPTTPPTIAPLGVAFVPLLMFVGCALVEADVNVLFPVMLAPGVPAGVIFDEIKTLSLKPKTPVV